MQPAAPRLQPPVRRAPRPCKPAPHTAKRSQGFGCRRLQCCSPAPSCSCWALAGFNRAWHDTKTSGGMQAPPQQDLVHQIPQLHKESHQRSTLPQPGRHQLLVALWWSASPEEKIWECLNLSLKLLAPRGQGTVSCRTSGDRHDARTSSTSARAGLTSSRAPLRVGLLRGMSLSRSHSVLGTELPPCKRSQEGPGLVCVQTTSALHPCHAQRCTWSLGDR